MSDRIIPDECSECGAELDDEYDVEVYHVRNPAESGYHNPVLRGVLDAIGHDAGDMHYPTCPDCETPETPPVPSEGQHQNHLVGSGLWAVLLGLTAVSPPPTFASVDVVLSAVAAIVLAAVAVGEYIQIARIRDREASRWERRWDVEPVLADDDADPVEDAREAYLRGEIDEAELEARLDEKLTDDERDRETRVMER